MTRETVRLSDAQTPSPKPRITAMIVATRTWESVSIASAQTPMKPIRASMKNVVIAGRSPEITNAISTRPPSVVNHGASTRNAWSGRSSFVRMKLPTDSVIWKTHVVGSAT